MEIYNLKDKKEYIEEVSSILWNQWQKWDECWLSLEDTIKRTKNIFKSNNWIPTILIALDWNKLIWTISLWINDINYRQDLFPFVASFYVKDDYRRRWVWKKLMLEIENIALKNNWETLYLNDSSWIDNLYEKFWYSFYEKDSYNWNYYKIYNKNLSIKK